MMSRLIGCLAFVLVTMFSGCSDCSDYISINLDRAEDVAVSYVVKTSSSKKKVTTSKSWKTDNKVLAEKAKESFSLKNLTYVFSFLKNHWLASLFLMFVIWGCLGIRILSPLVYYVLSLPFYVLNQLQFVLQSPMRYISKDHDSLGAKLGRTIVGKVLFTFVDVCMYLVCFPLRFINALYYNGFVHVSCSFVDLIAETIKPSGHAKTYKKAFRVIPNFFRYVVLKGLVVLLESVLFVIIDTFYPALTLYHGTGWKSSVSITKPGSWKSSVNDFRCWFGKGVYFATVRSTASHYARSQSNPVMIVSRVSHGRMLNLAYVSKRMRNNVGADSNKTGRITNYGLKKGYTSVLSWTSNDKVGQKWWELIMLDKEGRYDHKWRIRPLYVIDLNTKERKRIYGGMSLWFL